MIFVVMVKLRSTTEAQVIAEFLRNELYRPEFDDVRSAAPVWLLNPDTTNLAENRARRELLFRRRRHLWNELPSDLQWWEVALDASELSSILVFPRGHWRRIAGPNRTVYSVVCRLQERQVPASELHHLARLRCIAAGIREGRSRGAVLLIGPDESHPCTLIEGNHRVVAAALEGGNMLGHLHYYAGFSRWVSRCAWHVPNLANLFRYSLRRLALTWQR